MISKANKEAHPVGIPPATRRQCPTRIDGGDVLIEQRISSVTCQERQRKHYHKCYSCVHHNAARNSGAGALPPAVRLQPIAPLVSTDATPPAKSADPSHALDARQVG